MTAASGTGGARILTRIALWGCLGVLPAAATAAEPASSAETIPAAYAPLIQACISSGGQAGWSTGGLSSNNILIADAPLKVTLNVWMAQQGTLPVTLYWRKGTATQQRLMRANDSLTVVSNLVWFDASPAVGMTLAWCSRVQ